MHLKVKEFARDAESVRRRRLEHWLCTARSRLTPWPVVAHGRDLNAVLMDFISSLPAASEAAYCPRDRNAQTGAKTSLGSQSATHHIEARRNGEKREGREEKGGGETARATKNKSERGNKNSTNWNDHCANRGQ